MRHKAGLLHEPHQLLGEVDGRAALILKRNWHQLVDVDGVIAFAFAEIWMTVSQPECRLHRIGLDD